MGCSSSKVAGEDPFFTVGLPDETDSSVQRGDIKSVAEKHLSSESQFQRTGRLRTLNTLNNSVEKNLSKLYNEHGEKAIFVGTGESGKSTVFKQMRLCYGRGFTDYERELYAKIIWIDTIRALRLFVDICDSERHNPDAPPQLQELVTQWFGVPGERSPNELNAQLLQSLDLTRRAFVEAEKNRSNRTFSYSHVNIRRDPEERRISGEFDRNVISRAMTGAPINAVFPEWIMEGRSDTELEPASTHEALGDLALELWKACPESSKQLVENNQIGLETNAAYFLNKSSLIKNSDYRADNDDILHARIKTTGITEAEFRVKKSKLLVMDVGGQRIERDKWIHNFDDITCISFVASVSEYDQVLDEDQTINRLDETLEVFQQTVNSRWFKAKSVQLFSNKTDILAQKCSYSSFGARFRNFHGNDTNPDEIIQYIENSFRARFVPNSRNLYVHRTCATDTTAMKFVVNAVSDMILFENMKWAGMI